MYLKPLGEEDEDKIIYPQLGCVVI